MPLTKKQKIHRQKQKAIKNGGGNSPSGGSQKRRSSDGGDTNVKARRERANALVSRDSSAPQVGKSPALRRSDASESKIEAGAFLQYKAVPKDPVNTITDASNFDRPTVTDARTGRTLFGTITTNRKGKEKTEYLPRQSEATPQELSAGKYIPEKTPSVGEELDQPPKTDPDNGDRKLFATQAADGSIQYYPKKNQATAKELAEGKYLEGFAAKDPVNKLKAPSELKGKRPTTKEFATGRTLFATAALKKDGKEGKIEYLPRQSDATIEELNAGKYIPEKASKAGEELDQPPKTDPDNGDRQLFATQAADGSIQYYPKKNQATAKELAEGKYLEGFAAKDPVNKLKAPSELKGKPPTTKEVATGRTLFATAALKKDGEEGKIEYLPRQSDATIEELNAGKYIPEKASEAGEELDQPPKTDPDNGDRQLFATQAADGSIEYFPRKNQATAQELAEGKYLEGVAAKPPVNQILDPSDLDGKRPTVTEHSTGRTVYATAVLDSDGKRTKKIEYLPRQGEATLEEINAGKYIPEKASIAGEELFQPPKADPDNSDRKLFATKADDGSIQYFPKKNQATAQELAEGRYLEGFAAKDPANTIEEASKYKRPTVTEVSTGRTLFATTTTNWLGRSKTEYLPRQSEATEQELLTGKYIPEPDSIVREVLLKRPRYDFENQRDLLAVKADDGSNHYWPKKSQATAKELSEGRYVEDEAISQDVPLGPANAMSHKASKFDSQNNRKIFAVITKEGDTSYLPQESEATSQEKAQGLYIPDDVVDDHESKRRRTAIKDNSADRALRRAQRAARQLGI